MRPFGRFNAEMRCISTSLRVKSNTLKLSAMRAGFDERGMAATFCCISQRSAICAMLLPRAFSLSAPFVEMQTTGEILGRTVFGLGAVVVWIYVIALTVGTVRKLFDRRGG